ncbi:DUF6114 domain-containing protein [Krasilnikoviella flava]|uniref:Uncharacterized protein n=1 Tax=Krasilnikoviella flava TaxID=526729 RepID=A0A1T5J6Y4_9MICO|nr:DUF6114 domain-containing protein [Krasilnikoviella flava]SKC47141.1 hypothetical protein SAMN04324258_1089 [Krasilnikoviella flava]
MSDENTPSIPEGTPESSTAATTASPHEAPATRRERFAAWRRDRPFWGGTLAILSGVVLWFSGRLQIDNFEIQLGIEGMQSTLLPVALVLLGALLLAQPQFRVFYGVITLAISVYSLLGVNLGGFGVGMILGVVGGILAVSWMPRPAAEASASTASRAGEGPATAPEPAVPTPADPRAEGEEVGLTELLPFDEEPAPGRRHAAIIAAVAVVALGGTGTTAVEAAAAAPTTQVRAASDCWDPLGWLEWACGGDDEADPTPSPSPSATAGAGETDGGATTGGAAAGSEDAGTDDDATSDDGDAGKEGKAGKGATDKDAPSGEQAQDDVEKEFELELGPCARITFGGEYDINVSLPGDCGKREDANVFSVDGELETRDLQLPLTGINGIDVVNVPVTTGGPRRDALRINVDSVKVPGFWLKTYADNDGKVGGTVTDADYVSMEGDAQMYISSIHADLPDGDDWAELGEKIAAGASPVEMLLGLTDARIGLMGATSDKQVWSQFREQVWEE